MAFASLLASIALSTLIWSGHGAMDTGARGVIHLVADAMHLLAAGAWVGALVAFLLLLLRPSNDDGHQHLLLLRRAVAGFSTAGTVIVAVLIVTGTVNYVLIVGPTWLDATASLYGALLIVKLGLFAVVLALAAANRFRLVPHLERTKTRSEIAAAKHALFKSMALETGAVTLILLLVAWLGTLSPPASSAAAS